MTFRFRQFSVEDDASTMKTGTDAILLGSWIDPGNAERILDIGTGCGVMALMMAQKSTALIDAVDIDEDSINEASSNFKRSPWNDRLTASHRSLSEFAGHVAIKYDLILTNPPFFRNSLKSREEKRNLARHHDTLTLAELFDSVNKLLAYNGVFYIILPFAQNASMKELAGTFHLYANQILNIRPKERVECNRVLAGFSRIKPEKVVPGELTIRHADNSFTSDYKELTRDFYLGLP
jgi:tRNA1Val (adenine37-N6)-methyltransferase